MVEEAKSERERGYYIHPDLYGAPEEKQVEWARHPDIMRRLKDARAKHLAAPPKAIRTRANSGPLAGRAEHGTPSICLDASQKGEKHANEEIRIRTLNSNPPGCRIEHVGLESCQGVPEAELFDVMQITKKVEEGVSETGRRKSGREQTQARVALGLLGGCWIDN